MPAPLPPKDRPRSGAPAGAPLSLKVLLDFDGTLVEPNVAIVLVGAFVPDGERIAREIDLKLHDGELTLREAWAREVELLPLHRMEEMAAYVVEKVPLRQGAKRLLGLLREHRVPYAVVSGGLDFYIRPVLAREGIEAPVYADSLEQREPHGPHRLVHPYGHATCRLCGICKAQVVRASRTGGERVVFVGDGSTDRYAAEVADVVFARHRLQKYCATRGIPHVPFEDFHSVGDRLEAWLKGSEPFPVRHGLGLSDSPCPISRGLCEGGQPRASARATEGS